MCLHPAINAASSSTDVVGMGNGYTRGKHHNGAAQKAPNLKEEHQLSWPGELG